MDHKTTNVRRKIKEPVVITLIMEKQGLYLKVAESINTLLCQLKNIVLMNTFAWTSYTKAWGALLESKIKIKKIYKKFSIVFIWLKSSFFITSMFFQKIYSCRRVIEALRKRGAALKGYIVESLEPMCVVSITCTQGLITSQASLHS